MATGGGSSPTVPTDIITFLLLVSSAPGDLPAPCWPTAHLEEPG